MFVNTGTDVDSDVTRTGTELGLKKVVKGSTESVVGNNSGELTGGLNNLRSRSALKICSQSPPTTPPT